MEWVLEVGTSPLMQREGRKGTTGTDTTVYTSERSRPQRGADTTRPSKKTHTTSPGRRAAVESRGRQEPPPMTSDE